MHKKGEIFGLSNLFSYVGDQVVLRDIVNKTNVAESRAGVSVIDVDLEDLDEENASDDPLLASDDSDGAMSQLAALVASGESANSLADGSSAPSTTDAKQAGRPPRKKKLAGGAKKSDPVQAILAGAGVEYTHENSEVIGSSRVEAHLSRRATEAGNDFDLGEQQVFRDTQDLLHERIMRHSQLQVGAGGNGVGEYKDGSGGGGGGGGGGDDEGFGFSGEGNLAGRAPVEQPVWMYKPPPEVMRRQFCTMAKTFGFESATEFALVVEGWTQAQRRSCLDKFYRMRRERLGVGVRKIEVEDG